MKKLIKAGQFLRILDEQGQLSISNLAAILMLYKIATTPALSMADISLAMVGLIPYMSKKFINKQKDK